MNLGINTKDNTRFISPCSVNASLEVDPANLRVALQHLASRETVDTLPVPLPKAVLKSMRKPMLNSLPPLSVTFPCGSVQQGGRYSARLLSGGRLLSSSAALLVRWPPVFTSLPSKASSHTSVVARVRPGPESLCPPRGRRRFSVSARLVVAESNEVVSKKNGIVSKKNGVVSKRSGDKRNVSEPLQGRVTFRYPLRDFYEREPDIPVPCDRLDRQGFYQLQLVANTSDSALIAWSNVMRVQWHEAFQLNVRGEVGRKVFPCRSGVWVYYDRPKCAAKADVVRVYGMERAAVSSAVPPITERYVGDQRVFGKKNATSFSCSMFSERYTKYCFSYMAFGWKGSVHRVKTVCIPTLPPTRE